MATLIKLSAGFAARTQPPAEFSDIGSLRLATTRIAALCTCPDHARDVGRLYLLSSPNPTALLADSGLTPQHVAFMSDHALRCQIRRVQIQQFAQGDTVLVGGWILSRSEASLCALIAAT